MPTPRIVVLDADPANPGDLSWGRLEALGDASIYATTPDDQILERIGEAEVVLTNKVPLTAETIAALPRLRYIGSLATGYDPIDVAAARHAGIVVTNIPGYSTASTAQHAIALLLELTQHVGEHDAAVRAGVWTASRAFCFWQKPLIELEGKHMVIVGYGAIGERTGRIAAAMGMRVSAVGWPGRSYDQGVPRVGIAEAFAEADVLSLHTPLTAQTHHLVNAERLATMKASALVINVARGPVVDDVAMAQALHAGQIAGYASDVLPEEPPPLDQPLLTAPRCVLTPHVAWATIEARDRLISIATDNVEAFLAGDPQHRVD